MPLTEQMWKMVDTAVDRREKALLIITPQDQEKAKERYKGKASVDAMDGGFTRIAPLSS